MHSQKTRLCRLDDDLFASHLTHADGGAALDVVALRHRLDEIGRHHHSVFNRIDTGGDENVGTGFDMLLRMAGGAGQAADRLLARGASIVASRKWPVCIGLLGGGAFTSRLFQEVREKRGLAYSVFSGLSAYRDSGVFTVYAGCANEAVAELVLLLLRM